jgi:hypothetical protein
LDTDSLHGATAAATAFPDDMTGGTLAEGFLVANFASFFSLVSFLTAFSSPVFLIRAAVFLVVCNSLVFYCYFLVWSFSFYLSVVLKAVFLMFVSLAISLAFMLPLRVSSSLFCCF